jgi:polysaccharide chain length determinant protein (PEP-CTERM system associated)
MESIRAELEGETPSFGLGSSTMAVNTGTSYDARIEVLEQNLDNLLLQYTNSHPDVVSVRRVLKNLISKRDKEIAEKQQDAMVNEYTGYNLDENPVYQQMKINLGEAKAQVETLKVRVAAYSSKYDKLKEMVNTIPEIEAKLVSLNRDYDVTKIQYEEFLTRRESATIAENVDKTTDSIQFKVIESPRVENKPVGPPRLLLSTIVLVVGLGAGIAFTFVLTQLMPVVLSANELSRFTGLPMLGTVSAITSPAQHSRRKIMVMSYLSLLVLLLVVYGTIMTWYTVLLQNA